MLASTSQHVPVRFDPGSRNPHLDYIDNKGPRHEIWFLDATTAFNQIRSVVARQVHGIALRELGAEDQSIWPFFKLSRPAARSGLMGSSACIATSSRCALGRAKSIVSRM